LWVFGVKGKANFGPGWVRGEVDKNFGQNRPTGAQGGAYNGWQFLADAGYKTEIRNATTLTPWAQFGVGSGGSHSNDVFTPIAGDYRPGGIYGLFAPTPVGAAATPATLGAGTALGTVSSNSLADRVIWGLGVKATPASLAKLSTGISLYDYRYQTLGSNSAFGTPAAASGNKHIGSEVDINVAWAHSDNVSFGVAIGTFQAGGAIINAANTTNDHRNSPATLAQANASVKF
jgi:hypothetical protein